MTEPPGETNGIEACTGTPWEDPGARPFIEIRGLSK